MIILIVTVALIGFGIFCGILDDWDLGWKSVIAIVFILVAAMGLIVEVAMLPTNYYEQKEREIKYEVLTTQLKQARIDKDNIERYGILKDIIEYNTELQKAKFYNQTIFGFWIPDAVENLKLIDIEE